MEHKELQKKEHIINIISLAVKFCTFQTSHWPLKKLLLTWKLFQNNLKIFVKKNKTLH
jgi:hypothetical protein